MLYSHENIKLIDHLKGVLNIGVDVYKNKKKLLFPFEKKHIEVALKNMLFFHDLGKSTAFFQQYLKESIENEEISVSKDLRKHSLISALYAGLKTYKDTNSKILSLIVFESIKKHHGNLEDFDSAIFIEDEHLKKIWDNLNFKDLNIKNEIKYFEIKDYIDFLYDLDEQSFKDEYYFILNFFFSILTYSDKTEVIFHKKIKNIYFSDVKNFVNKYKAIKFKNVVSNELNELRESAYLESFTNLNDAKIFSLNLPTGIGKTLNAFNLAFNSLNSQYNKIIYALPYTSIVDQTAKIAVEMLKINELVPENYLTVHHHLSEIEYKNNDDFYKGEKAQFLIENWDKPLIITTFWQLFNSIITNQNLTLRKFHNISNSIIILDEIQTLPYIYWNLIKDIFEKITKIFNIKIIIMTATMPFIFKEDKINIFPLINDKKKYFSKFSRYKISKINNLNTIYLEDISEIALKDLKENPQKDFLFVFNTIKSSTEFFKLLKENINEKITYLSTNITPIERLERINYIKTSKKRKIVVSTQLIEAGVDIDLDVIYRDLAPLDNIIQTAGRCNRNNKNQMGLLKLFSLKRNKSSKKEDFEYIYKKVVLIPTKEVLRDIEIIYEKDLLEYLEIYYKKIHNNMSTDMSKKILENIKKLNYDKIYKNFNLIENTLSVSIFIEKDEKASKILKVFKNILSINDFYKRKESFLKIKKEFYDYTISLIITKENFNSIKNFEEYGNIKILTKEMIDLYYDKNIGFINKSNEFII
ncbi:CRISPR-associated helicase/endonuclease Cas3 [Tepiditoga spiralis]|uniref:CRISPR-associated helicase/endonuclease Cas3 n=1 Tax=Tepiditoga spiralis TaxID=2108365 RepID=A0A7G1G8N3_9BACT|nr:CRISPR-associated helicase Cas3' [Tepiditoga spiralis]BBE30402.1 CRISPR-associated helicase/endonuclease Cas3 [Tepiditoga spiralis]